MIRGMHRLIGLLLIALLLAAVFLLSLPDATAWQRVAQDAGHGPVFAGIAVIVLWLQQPQDGIRSPRMYWRAFLIAAGLGVASELVQFFQNGRNVSLFDVIHDTAGAGLGLALVATAHFKQPQARRLLAAMILAALVLLAWQPLRCAIAYAERSRAFPVLLQATRSADLYFVRARDAKLERAAVPGTWHVGGEHDAVRLVFVPGRRPALELEEPAPDWRGYDRLLLELVNPGEQPLHFTLRILDAQHDWSHEDRFNMPVVAPPFSRSTLQVSLVAVASAPARRPMDMGAIANVMLFAQAPLTGTEFYVTRIWLQ